MYNQMTINTVTEKIRTLKHAIEPAVIALETGDGWNTAPGDLLTAVNELNLYGTAFCERFPAPELKEALEAFKPLADALGAAIAIPAKVAVAREIQSMIPALEAAAESFTPKPSPIHDRSAKIYR